jgi:hypothetical protein
VDDEVFARIREARRSKVTFAIEPLGQVVKLTVVQDDRRRPPTLHPNGPHRTERSPGPASRANLSMRRSG